MRLELQGFAPDLDPATPGVLTDCDAIVPATEGLAAANSLVSSGYPALAAAPLSAFVAEQLDGTKRTFAATAAAIYEASAGAWVDRSRVGGYTGSNRTRFTVFGNAVLSANRSEAIQASIGGAFADIATAPSAGILVSASGFVMALNINGMTLGDVPDGWGCSGIRDHTVWTPSVTTQCAAGRLIDAPGPITAGAELGGDVIAYKGRAMFVGRYVGGALVWQWTRIPGDIGCSGQESLVKVDTVHYFVGPDDFYSFDGTVPRSIGAPIREWFFHDLSQADRDKVIGVSDEARQLIYWHYPSANSGGVLDSCVVYNHRTGKWGRWRITIQCPLQYSSGQITFDGLGALYSTYDTLPSIAYDSPFWLSDDTLPGVFQGNSLYSLTGTPGASWFVTGDYGDLTDYSFLDRVTPRYRVSPTTATATNYHRESLDATLVQDATIGIERRRFDFRRAARWHRIRVDQTGPAVINGLDLSINAESRE